MDENYNEELVNEELEHEQSILDIYPEYINELAQAIQTAIDNYNVQLINKLDIIAPIDMISNLSDLVILAIEGGELDGEGDDE